MLRTAPALVLVLGCSAAVVDKPADIEAATVTLDGDKRQVTWTTEPSGVSVDVLISGPKPGENARRLVEGNDTSRYEMKEKSHQRTYFTIRTPNGEERMTALRVLPLEGGRNFRDLGGYETEDGREVKWGLVFRSGVLNDLTDRDYQFVEGLGIKTVLDFRANSERASEPTDWRAGDAEIVTWDYESSGSEQIGALFQQPGLQPADVENIMTMFYSSIFIEYADKYTVMFDRLVSTEAPLAFHCTAGKDRTGMGTALLLTALGVPRETVVADYAMSDDVMDYMAELQSRDLPDDSPYAMFSKFPPELVRPLMASNPRYIEAALNQIDEDFGSVLDFIQSELDVDDTELARLRERLLTE